MSKDLEIDDRLERIMWKGFGKKSIRKLSEETGLPPDVILAHKRELFEAVDDLTLQQKRQKLMFDLEEMSDKLREDYEKSPYEFKAGLMNSSIAAMKTILTELNRNAKQEQEAVDRLNGLRIQELIRLVELSVDKTFLVIAERYDIDEELLHEVFRDFLRPAAEELEQ